MDEKFTCRACGTRNDVVFAWCFGCDRPMMPVEKESCSSDRPDWATADADDLAIYYRWSDRNTLELTAKGHAVGYTL